MKKFAIAGCAALIAGPACAQNSVTLYGIIDTGVEYVTDANAKGDSILRMPSITGELPSRWGVRGNEDLGGGLQAVFVLESGFDPGSGSLRQGGRLFGRQSWVGLKSPAWGTLSFGRQYSMGYWGIQESDILGPNIYAIASFDAYLPNARSDNSVAYLSPTFYGFSFGATYSFGRDSTGTGNSPGQGTCAGGVPGQLIECRQLSARLKYDGGFFGASAVYDEQRGGTNAAANFSDGVTPAPIPNSGDKDARIEANGWTQLGPARIGAGWIVRMVTGPSVTGVRANLFYVGTSILTTPTIIVDGEVYRMIVSQHDTRGTLGTVRLTYMLSKRTAVYAQTSYLENSAKARFTVSSGGSGTTPAAGQGQFGAMVGIRHSF
ncbi:porin [Paraburkholderia sp. BL25I1N1]|uniref:porin n=1 Tax=Paraburkholderia sp. BL25I1N1 TaxID=1938804 RepID=UPI000D064018|nr:porin [Paraburkholderia sp. BL25I1N1]PRX96398.1 putative porin [Paraburkholderia sp. BL25I1N1]